VIAESKNQTPLDRADTSESGAAQEANVADGVDWAEVVDWAEEAEPAEAAESVEAAEPSESAEPSEAEAPSEKPEPSVRSRRKLPHLSPRTAVVTLVIAVLAAGVIVSQWQLSDQRDLASARDSATTAARAYAIDVASYDYQHLNRDFAAVEQESTPAFRKTFVQSSASLAKVLGQYKAVARGSVVASGVTSATTSKAVVVLFVNQTVTNTAQTNGSTPDNSRIQMTLVRPGSKWLISDLKLL
jgi:Mce-associated membrane protein